MAAIAHDDADDGLRAEPTSRPEETQAGLDRVREGLSLLGLPDEVTQALVAVLTCAAAHASTDTAGRTTAGTAAARVATPEEIDDAAALAAAHGARVVAGFAEGALVDSARTLADRAGTELLARKQLTDPGQLSRSARQKWRARTKSLVAGELSVLTGHGIQAAHAIVGFALAPPACVAASTTALREGRTDWRAVSAFWSRCRAFETAAAAEVDQGVFGPLLAHPTPEDITDPDTDTPDSDTEAEGADAEGDEGAKAVAASAGQDQRRESWAEFSRRLEREAVRAESADAAEARAQRRAAMSRRDVHARIGDHGTGEVILTGSTTCVAGAIERIETIARAAKAAGDPRSLGQIRSDTAFALLVHGVLPLPLPGTCTGSCTAHTGTADTTSSTGTTDTDTGSTGGASTARGTSAAFHGNTTDEAGTGTTPGRRTGSAAGSVFSTEALIDSPQDIHRIITGQPATHVEVIIPASFLGPDPNHRTDPEHPTAPDETDTPAPGDQPTRTADPGDGADHPQRHRLRRRPGGVAEIIGYGFLTGEHARELVATPGTTLHRLLTDPADGRLLERSIAAYRPDHAMITQLRAADVFCRAPGCLVPARRCDIDHEQEHDQGGPTTEPNLGHKHRAHHQVKTATFWATVMNATRQVTWTTLFGRMYTTRSHDYTQCEGPPDTTSPTSSRPPTSTPEGSKPEGWVDPASITDPDTRGQLIYAALSTRTGMDQWLEAIDDDHHAWAHGHDRPLTLFHHVNGRRRPGPPPGQPDPDELINPTPPPAPDHDPPPF